MGAEAKLKSLGLTLPAAAQIPPGVEIPFAWARAHGGRVHLSGHGPLAADGALTGPFGKVGAEVSLEEACEAARSATLALLASLKREIGDLDRVTAWLAVNGMVNVAPGFARTTDVINPCSALLLDLFGPIIGRHARTAVGMAQLPVNLPVVIAAAWCEEPERSVRAFGVFTCPAGRGFLAGPWGPQPCSADGSKPDAALFDNRKSACGGRKVGCRWRIRASCRGDGRKRPCDEHLSVSHST